jgi:hypothetical protein
MGGILEAISHRMTRGEGGFADGGGWVRADGAEEVAGGAGLVAEGETARGLGEGGAEDGIGGFDEDGADVDAAVGDDAAVGADELLDGEIDHHVFGDVFGGA